tara:strand:+ start:1700 stop:1873 length:174 start_codon:yes stop_codon:yes gene_type:complete
MTVVVWIKREIVLDWEHYKNNPQEIYNICTREPGDLDFVQVNITVEEYKQILTSTPT